MPKPYGRLEHGYINHPKFLALTGNAMALWHETKDYCDVYLTEGLVPIIALKKFRFYGKRAMALLCASCGEKASGEPYAPLLESHVKGYTLHHYLEHNDTAKVILARMEQADSRQEQERVRKAGWRAKKAEWRQRTDAVKASQAQPPDVPADVPLIVPWDKSGTGTVSSALQHNTTSTYVRKKKDPTDLSVPAKKPPDPRVKLFIEWFQAEYALRRHGAVYLVAWDKHPVLVKRMLHAVDVPHLKRLSQMLLSSHCNEGFIEESDRGIGILSTKFNWLSERLAAWDAAHPRVIEAQS